MKKIATIMFWVLAAALAVLALTTKHNGRDELKNLMKEQRAKQRALVVGKWKNAQQQMVDIYSADGACHSQGHFHYTFDDEVEGCKYVCTVDVEISGYGRWEL